MFVSLHSASEQPAVLVTGGAGYIGSHCCKALSKAGFFPITLDNLSSGHRYAVKWGPLIEGDLNDKSCLQEIFKQYKPIAVMHFAAYAIITESIEDPHKYYMNNTAATINLLDTMLQNDVKYLIFSSSCSTYGHATKIPITEETPLAPISPYGWSKLIIEQILKDYSIAYDLRSISLRYFNAAGADFQCQIGENHANETHLIPSILQVALGEGKHIKICGKDFETKDGTAIRDYIHVEDLAEGHIKALRELLREKNTNSINLGTGIGFSVQEIIDSAIKHCKKKLPVKFVNRRQGDPPILVANYGRAKKILKWEPKYSDLDTIIQTSWAWHQKMASLKDNDKIVKKTI